MPSEKTLSAPPPPMAPAPPVHLRVRRGLRHRSNWLQLTKFCLVGGSGYVVNLVVFTAALSVLGVHHLVAATIAFVVAVANNFWWNRHWTFAAGGESARFQAPRFFAVSTAAFVFQAAMLELLVVGASSPEVLAQAVSVAAATPLELRGQQDVELRHGPGAGLAAQQALRARRAPCRRSRIRVWLMEAHTFLKPGHPAWDRLQSEKRSARRWPPETPVEDLLRAGQRLSAQAGALRRAIRRDGRPARA